MLQWDFFQMLKACFGIFVLDVACNMSYMLRWDCSGRLQIIQELLNYMFRAIWNRCCGANFSTAQQSDASARIGRLGASSCPHHLGACNFQNCVQTIENWRGCLVSRGCLERRLTRHTLPNLWRSKRPPHLRRKKCGAPWRVRRHSKQPPSHILCHT
jgi:hypothetical protein